VKRQAAKWLLLLLLGVLPALLGGLLLRRGISAGRRKNQSADRQDPG